MRAAAFQAHWRAAASRGVDLFRGRLNENQVADRALVGREPVDEYIEDLRILNRNFLSLCRFAENGHEIQIKVPMVTKTIVQIISTCINIWFFLTRPKKHRLFIHPRPYKRTGDNSGWPVHQIFFLWPVQFFGQKFVARPVFPEKLSPVLPTSKIGRPSFYTGRCVPLLYTSCQTRMANISILGRVKK